MIHNLPAPKARDGAKKLEGLAFSPDGSLLAMSGPDNKTVHLWDTQGGRLLHTLKGDEWGLDSVVFSPDGRRRAKSVPLWDTQSRTLIHTLEGDEHRVDNIAFSPNGRLLVSSSYPEGKVRLWDVLNGTLLHTLKGHGAIAFSPDGRTLAAGTDEDRIRLWPLDPWVLNLFAAQGEHYEILRAVSIRPSPPSKTCPAPSSLRRMGRTK